MKNLYIHVQNKSWKVRTDEDVFDKEVSHLERVLNDDTEGSWVFVCSDPHSAEALIYLSPRLKKLAILETVVE